MSNTKFLLLCAFVLAVLALKEINNNTRCLRVVDGDTIIVTKNKRVRLIGVNTPETKHPRKGVEPGGKEASEWLKNRIEGKEINVTYDEKKHDHYGRTLGYIYFHDTLVNAELIEKGYGKAECWKPNTKFCEYFEGLQARAQLNKLGIWK